MIIMTMAGIIRMKRLIPQHRQHQVQLFPLDPVDPHPVFPKYPMYIIMAAVIRSAFELTSNCCGKLTAQVFPPRFPEPVSIPPISSPLALIRKFGEVQHGEQARQQLSFPLI